MKIGGFGDEQGSGWPGRRGGGVEDLPPGEAGLLWALRRLALLQPLGASRCHAVHIALQQDYGDAGQGLEHLLRCWLYGLARCAPRRLAIGALACPLVTEDEAQLLLAMRVVGADPAGAVAAMVPLVGGSGARRLLPLVTAIGVLAQNPAVWLVKTV